MPGRKDRDDDKETVYVPVLVRDEYEPYSERHPRRGWHLASGLLLAFLGLALLLASGPLERELPGSFTLALGLTLLLLGTFTLTEGLLSPLTRASAIVHVAAAIASALLAALTAWIAWLLFWANEPVAAIALLLISLTTAYRLLDNRLSTREAWAVARKGAPAWWRSGKTPENGKD